MRIVMDTSEPIPKQGRHQECRAACGEDCSPDGKRHVLLRESIGHDAPCTRAVCAKSPRIFFDGATAGPARLENGPSGAGERPHLIIG